MASFPLAFIRRLGAAKLGNFTALIIWSSLLYDLSPLLFCDITSCINSVCSIPLFVTSRRGELGKKAQQSERRVCGAMMGLRPAGNVLLMVPNVPRSLNSESFLWSNYTSFLPSIHPLVRPSVNLFLTPSFPSSINQEWITISQSVNQRSIHRRINPKDVNQSVYQWVNPKSKT